MRPPPLRLPLPAVSSLLAALLVLVVLSPASGQEPEIVTECDVAIPMADGVVLRGNLRRPAGVQVPTLLTSTGYGKDNTQHFAACEELGRYGLLPDYAVLVVDERGTGTSTGAWDWWGPKTQGDYEEILDWIQAQPWSDGTVGAYGSSYMAITSLFIAQADADRVADGKPRAVQAVHATVPMADLYRDIGFHGGNPVTFFDAFLATQSAQTIAPMDSAPPADAAGVTNRVERIANLVALSGPMAAEVHTGGDAAYDSEFYRVRSPVTRADLIEVPVLLIGGWFDLFQRGQPELFQSLTAAPRRLWFQGPQYHAPVPSGVMTRMGIRSLHDVMLGWWQSQLLDQPNWTDDLRPVNVYTMGAGRWVHADTWPLPDVRWQEVHLAPGPTGSSSSLNDGALSWGPGAEDGADSVPALPVAGICARSQAQWVFAGATAGSPCDTDNRAAELAALTYTTPPLEEEVEVTGPITATLHAETDRADATVVVTLTDVAPDGTSTQITQGVLNLAHGTLDEAASRRAPCGEDEEEGDVEDDSGQCRDGVVRPIVRPWHPFTRAAHTPTTAGEVSPYLVEVLPTSHAFAAGHRIRVTITTADTLHVAPTATSAAAAAGGTTRIHHGPTHPSHVLLPVRGAE